MKILVTGGAGFIGSNFVRYWLSTHPEDEITIIDKLTSTGRMDNLSGLESNITFLKKDIAVKEYAEQAVGGQDLIVHFAAEAMVDRSLSNPSDFVFSNVVGTFNLLEAARKNNTRFHHVSTDEVLGHLPLESKEKWNEKSPYDPRSPYSATKAASDHLVRAYYHSFNLPVTISNCANNIGPYMAPERLIPRAICRLLSGQNVPVYTPGNQVREWLHVLDHCEAIDIIISKGKIGETYFVAPDNEELSNMAVVKMLLEVMQLPLDRIELVPDRPGHDLKYALDHSKITNELGWTPKRDLKTTLVEMVDWFKNNTAWWESQFQEIEEFYNSKRLTK